MKALIVFLFVVVCQIQFIFAALSHAKVKSQDGKCTYGDHTFGPDETVRSINPCVRYECSHIEDDEYMVTIASCGKKTMSAEMRERCHFEPGDGPYPDCCPYKIVCND